MSSKVKYRKELKLRLYVMYSTAMFAVAFAAGFVMNVLQSQISPVLPANVQNHATLTGVRHTDIAAGGIDPFSTVGYFVHNTSIAIASWISGWGVFGPLYILWQNGMNLAGYAWGAIDSGSVSMIAFVIPHGILEIPAILIATGLGLYFAHISLTGVRKGLSVDYIFAIKESVPWMLLTIALLGIAAIIEANISTEFALTVEEILNG